MSNFKLSILSLFLCVGNVYAQDNSTNNQVEEIIEQPFDELEDLMFTPKEIIEEVSGILSVSSSLEENVSDEPCINPSDMI